MVVTMQWNDGFLLGLPAMDDTHREFVQCVAGIQSASDAELPERLEDFARHAVAHFGQEQQWMEGSDFPATQCHADEHSAVLASVQEVQALLAQGVNPQVARDLAQALVDWFPGHADYMDASLSQWMSKRSHGGAPVVLRRNVVRNACDVSLELKETP